ncbi:mannitol-1-phosphate 5-dehydrogenase [Alicyclobacillus suci]|uniref:mannitol-1-phosphate 5-dehydrogenase n=1 Tax=Alicyclobacillus suci TaxID=2816080 RepID=UPI001A8E46A8|nr:mannitol-1-phosphate 5-dehydrogenase [Alicyclobacillus suci]
MKKALHFGAGNIGRGFIGLLLHQAGYEVVFADVVPTLVEQLLAEKAYRVITLDDDVQEERVTGVRACLLDSDACRQEVIDADVITTAVGLGNLGGVSAVIADGLRLRKEQKQEAPINILACENAIRATSQLKERVLARVDDSLREWIDTHVGFVDVAVDRIAPNREGYATQPLDCVVERFFEWDIEEPALKGTLDIPGATFVQDLNPFLERKLFMLNGAHATAAYAGFFKHYRTVLEAMQDAEIASLVADVQMEAAEGLKHRYSSLSLDMLRTYAQAVRARFLNPHIQDDVARVGRDPLRKLSADDRLVGPLRLALAAKVKTPALIRAIAFGFHYNNPSDEAASKIQAEIQQFGIENTVKRITGLSESSIVDAIAEQYHALLRASHSDATHGNEV